MSSLIQASISPSCCMCCIRLTCYLRASFSKCDLPTLQPQWTSGFSWSHFSCGFPAACSVKSRLLSLAFGPLQHTSQPQHIRSLSSSTPISSAPATTHFPWAGLGAFLALFLPVLLPDVPSPYLNSAHPWQPRWSAVPSRKSFLVTLVASDWSSDLLKDVIIISVNDTCYHCLMLQFLMLQFLTCLFLVCKFFKGRGHILSISVSLLGLSRQHKICPIKD